MQNTTTPETLTAVYWVYSPKMDWLKEQVLRLNRRALKIGALPISLTATGNIQDEPVTRAESCGGVDNVIVGDPAEVVAYKRFIEVQVVGQAPKFSGWSLAAVIEATEEGNLLRKAPGVEQDLTRFRACRPFCEHCRTERNRRETYVVIHDNGDTKQVGGNCIKDFLGHNDPHLLAKLAELSYSLAEVCGEAEDDSGLDGPDWRSRPLLSVTTFLRYVALATRKLGYVSSTKEKEDLTGRTQSTKSTALNWIHPPRRAVEGRDFFRPEPVDEERAEAARQFVLDTLGSKPVEHLTDFEHNLLVCCKAEALEYKSAGILAYVVAYHSRETEKKALQATQRYFGTPKARVRKVELTYLRSTGFDSQFGYTFIHSFAGPEGERLVWKTGTELDYDAGQKLSATFTVKEHSTYNGNLQTLITRFVHDTAAGKKS